jgi:hypothetical protein
MDLEAAPRSSLEPSNLPAPRPALQSALEAMPRSREEVVSLPRPPLGDHPASERAQTFEAAARVREAALRASRTPAVEIIARLSQERSHLKAELARTADERAAALRDREEEARLRLERDAELAALRARFDELAAECERLRAEAPSVAPPSIEPDPRLLQYEEELATSRAREAEFASWVERLKAELVERDAERDELARLRHVHAELEHESGRRAALEAELAHESGRRATLEAELAHESGRRATLGADLERLREENARLAASPAALSNPRAEASPALGDAALAVDLTARLAAEDAPANAVSPLAPLAATVNSPGPTTRHERAIRIVAFGFGSRQNEPATPPPPSPSPSRSGRARVVSVVEDPRPRAHPYPRLDPRGPRERARLEKALRRLDQRLGRIEHARSRALREREAALVAQLEAAVRAFERAPRGEAGPSAPAEPAPRRAPKPAMFAAGGGVLAKLVEQNLALRQGSRAKHSS